MDKRPIRKDGGRDKRYKVDTDKFVPGRIKRKCLKCDNLFGATNKYIRLCSQCRYLNKTEVGVL